MKILVQRVTKAACVVNEKTTGAIEQGLLCYISFRQGDSDNLIPIMAKKLAHLRVFEDAQGKMNLSLKDTNRAVLMIPQFTLEANTKKGHRPSFTEALEPTQATNYFDRFNEALKTHGLNVQTGVFGAHMQIRSSNDGPVSLILERTNDHD